jgi:2-desacetyl-2-hydroxyethyl bacteriochlorophyllide A dehydrogenase
LRAAVMRSIGAPLSIEEVPRPEIGPDEVLVETRTSGICGTDLHILSGHGYVPALPHILGHEPAGVVAEVGSRVTGLKAGDRVVPHLFFSCDRCYFCRAGRHQQCTNLKGILGVLCAGAFADYFKVPAANLFVLPRNVPFDLGGLIADAVVTALHASRRASLKLGDSALVLGAGGVGQNLIQILSVAGINVVAVDRSPEKLNLAREMGALLTFKLDDFQACLETLDASLPDGLRCAFNCVGTGESLRLCADFVMQGGRIVIIGEEREPLSINTTEIAQKELEIIGSRNGTRQDMVDAIRLLEAGVVKPYVAGRYALEEINEAIRQMQNNPVGRLIVVMKEE